MGISWLLCVGMFPRFKPYAGYHRPRIRSDIQTCILASSDSCYGWLGVRFTAELYVEWTVNQETARLGNSRNHCDSNLAVADTGSRYFLLVCLLTHYGILSAFRPQEDCCCRE